ncbi:MAG: hypothetical protein KF878_00015 [Planctomycetes bacterium]|nr:hypothetical protein [Planctomycetota bacterium]
MPGEDPWTRLCDAVALLGCTPAQACAWVDAGRLRHLETPTGIWVHVEDVLAIERGRAHERELERVERVAGRVA